MLTSLHIENVAVIERAAIDLSAGLNVLTGETGAGKSIVIDAIGAVLGERIRREVVRTGSDQARVTALFADISAPLRAALEEWGYPVDEEGCLLIQRTISAEGKGSCRINGQPVTVALLRTIGRRLVNMHGQHENQTLLQPEMHAQYLEQLGGFTPVREAYDAAYRALCDVQRERDAFCLDEGDKAWRIDMLRYQVEEIDAAQLRPGEEDELKAQRELLRNARRIADDLTSARVALSGTEDTAGALSLLSDACSCLSDAGQYVEEAAQTAERLQTLLYEAEECGGEVRALLGRLDGEGGGLDQIEERLDVLHRLTQKYGGDEQAVLAFGEQARRELVALESADVRAAELERLCDAALEEAQRRGEALTAARRQAAQAFVRTVGQELTYLDMPQVRLAVGFEKAPLGPYGLERVEFLIAANVGETPRPLTRIASGGELSRIMLAIKAVMADIDDVDTLIFDEIDTGISGRAAQKVGGKLREIGSRRQTLCVTHLAQIAAQAHHHFRIEKAVRDGRTYTAVQPLDRAGRVEELARIIGGEATPANRRAAEEMLDSGENSA